MVSDRTKKRIATAILAVVVIGIVGYMIATNASAILSASATLAAILIVIFVPAVLVWLFFKNRGRSTRRHGDD